MAYDLGATATAVFRRLKASNMIGSRAFPAMGFSPDPVLNHAMELTATFAMPNADLEPANRILMNDPVLAELRPKNDGTVPTIVQEGSGSPVASEMLVTGLLCAAMLRIYLLDEPATLAKFKALLNENLDELLRAVKYRRVNTTKLIGFTGMQLDHRVALRTPWGTLTSAPWPAVHNAHRGTAAATTVILSRPIELPVTLSAESRYSAPLPADETTRRAITLLPLAVLLGTAGKQRLAPIAIWHTELQRFSPFAGYVPTFALTTPTVVYPTLARKERSAVERWATTVDKIHTSKLDVAVRRVVSAAAQRARPEDRLIDASIAWESLLGTGTETSFRLCAATAKLLEPNAQQRRVRYDDLRKLYQKRSKTVHGTPQPSSAIELASIAVLDLVCECLRTLYQDRPHMLALDSEKRADSLLICE